MRRFVVILVLIGLMTVMAGCGGGSTPRGITYAETNSIYSQIAYAWKTKSWMSMYSMMASNGIVITATDTTMTAYDWLLLQNTGTITWSVYKWNFGSAQILENGDRPVVSASCQFQIYDSFTGLWMDGGGPIDLQLVKVGGVWKIEIMRYRTSGTYRGLEGSPKGEAPAKSPAMLAICP